MLKLISAILSKGALQYTGGTQHVAARACDTPRTIVRAPGCTSQGTEQGPQGWTSLQAATWCQQTGTLTEGSGPCPPPWAHSVPGLHGDDLPSWGCPSLAPPTVTLSHTCFQLRKWPNGLQAQARQGHTEDSAPPKMDRGQGSGQ